MDFLSEILAKLFSRVAEGATGLGGDAGGVEVDVVGGVDVGGETAGEAGRKGVGEGVEGVGYC